MTDADKKLYDKAEELFCQNCKLRTEQCLFAYRKVNGIEDCRKSCGCEEVPAWIDGYQKGQKDFMAAAEPIGKALYDMARDVAEDVKWHYPSKGELPKEHRKRYLIATPGLIVGAETRTNLGKDIVFVNDFGTFERASEVIAWRELPEPPKEKED